MSRLELPSWRRNALAKDEGGIETFFIREREEEEEIERGMRDREFWK